MVAVVVLVPAAAVAGAKLISNDDVAKSLPAGALLAPPAPTRRAPAVNERRRVPVRAGQGARPGGWSRDWKGTVEPTVDQTKHVNGGCRSLNSAGTSWECCEGGAYID